MESSGSESAPKGAFSRAIAADAWGKANAERDENGWELWYVLQRYTDLCPSCVPIARSICGESRRIPNPQFLSEDESYSADAWLKEDP